MNTLLKMTVLFVTVVPLSAPADAQELPSTCRMEGQTERPSGPFRTMSWNEHLARLSPFVGDWVEDATAYSSAIPGGKESFRHRVQVRWLPGCVWLQHDMEFPAGTAIGPTFGSWRTSWDDETEEYARFFIDNHSPKVLETRGRWREDGTLEFSGSMDWYGTTFYFREEFKMTSGRTYEARGWMGTDPEELKPNFEARATRADR